jgi:hypothetical protein
MSNYVRNVGQYVEHGELQGGGGVAAKANK